MVEKNITIFWFRQDLRITDNPALFEAAKNGYVMPVYILDDINPSEFKLGAASRWWLHNSLINLNKTLENKLNLYIGNPKDIITDLIRTHDIKAVYWNRCYEPWRIKRDAEIKNYLKDIKIESKSFNASLLWEPWEILKNDATPYKIYTFFYRKGCLEAPSPKKPLPKPERLLLVKDENNINVIDSLKLLSANLWYQKIQKYWDIGEDAAQRKMTDFLKNNILGYKEGRNYPSRPNVSKLSAHLHFGEISPNQVWHDTQNHSDSKAEGLQSDIDCFLSEIGWREFSNYLLYHFPELPHKNFQSKFDQFPWQDNATLLKAWQKGQTGYPIVDAGMRELWQTGYMHNRVRMIVGSFLVKNLLVHWRHGEAWFWDCLVDADLANNSASWQWIAGSGADAAPYFRIFNPITQGEKFDPEGKYTRRFIPELDKIPNQYLFKPYEAPRSVLEAAGVTLGKDYPEPIVSLIDSREQALAAYFSISKNLQQP